MLDLQGLLLPQESLYDEAGSTFVTVDYQVSNQRGFEDWGKRGCTDLIDGMFAVCHDKDGESWEAEIAGCTIMMPAMMDKDKLCNVLIDLR